RSVARYFLSRGPCDGVFRDLATRPKVNSEVTCGGDLYIFQAGGYYQDAGPADLGILPPGTPDVTPAGGARAVRTKQVGTAWTRLTHALAVTGPHELRKTRAQGARAKRGVR